MNLGPLLSKLNSAICVGALTACSVGLLLGCGSPASHADGAIQGDAAIPIGGPDPYPGIDIDYYPGDSVMLALVATYHVKWTGFYLYPAPDHSAADPNMTTLGSWMDKRQRLLSFGLGMAPIYVGKQPGWISVLSNATGTTDGANAASLAQKAGFPTGTVIYLDIEPGGPYASDFMTYVQGWISGVVNANYYPGVYVHSGDASQIISSDSRPLIWSVNLALHSCDTNISSLIKPSDSGYKNSTAWQYAQNCSLVIEGKSWTFDFDVASTSDPSVYPASVAPASITVTTPSAGESWQIGQHYSVSWTSSGVSSPLRIVVTKGGVEMSPTISTSAASTGSQDVLVLTTWPIGNDYRACVTGSAGTVSGCSGYFSVTANSASGTGGASATGGTGGGGIGGSPSIVVTSPVTAEVWRQGNTYVAAWTSSGVSAPLRMVVRKGGVELSPSLSTTAPISGIQYVAVPDSWALGSDYDLCLTANLGAVAGCSGYFSVAPRAATGTGGSYGDAGLMGTGGIIGTGGVVGTGGITGTGGVAGSGAVTGTGGITISGGIIGTGGLVATGGIIGTGGAVGTGGVAGAGVVAGSGAVTGTGGITISGGTIGTIGTGGLVATGGIIGTGGAVGTGGGASTGGVTGTGGAGTWRCEGKTNLIENKQFTWYTNPTVSGSYTMSLYDTPLVGSSVGPSNPYKSDAGAIYADQIATGNLSTLAAGNYWGCVEAEVFSSSGQVSVEVKVVSAPPAAYGTTVITGPATLGVERKTICALGSITGALDGWQFAFQVWTTGANYGIYRAAICQVN